MTFLVVLGFVVAFVAWLGWQAHVAPHGCDSCQGVTDCPNCGPVAGRSR